MSLSAAVDDLETRRHPPPEVKAEAEAEAGAGAGVHVAATASAAEKESIRDVDSSNDSDKTSAPAPDEEQEKDVEERSKAQTAVIVSALCLCVLLAALDATIITTALPTISEHFQSSAGYTWIGSAYLLANAASVPSWGKFSDIFGRKPILQTAAVVFFIGSALCGAAVSIEMLIIGRVVQGIGGGGLIVLVNICISDLFTMRYVIILDPGGTVMGTIADATNRKRSTYFGIVGMGLKAIDWLGSLTVVSGTVMFLLGLEFGGVTFPWSSPKVICLIVFGLVIGGLFILIEWKVAKYPVMPLRLFKKISNVAALAVALSHGFVFIAGSYYLPLYFQAALGATPLLSGVYLLPFVLVLSFGSGVVGVYIRKTGRYLEPIWFGMTLMTIGVGLFINLDENSSWAKIILYQIVAGLGVGPNFQSPLIALQSLVSPRDIATTTATFGFVRQLATSISVVVGGVVFQNGMQTQMPALQRLLGNDTASLLSGGSAGANIMIVERLEPGPRAIARAAFATSLKKMWILYVCVGAAGMVASAFIGKQTLSKVHHKTETGLAGEEARRTEAAKEKQQEKDEKNDEKDLERGRERERERRE
ncbi:MAG: hypothetical protein M1837_003783 [Sclerophora amabilis]|nr:MAG: hypothetical protein M1837_003783 [Sclerophora amabilis]